MDDASFVLTTAHKAKGMEFETVWLADDYSTVEEMQVSITLSINPLTNFSFISLRTAEYFLDLASSR